jgi:ribosomal protein L37AE/L43A
VVLVVYLTHGQSGRFGARSAVDIYHSWHELGYRRPVREAQCTLVGVRYPLTELVPCWKAAL